MSDKGEMKEIRKEEKKPGWLRRHGFMFGTKPANTDEVRELKLHDLGVAILKDGKLEGRMRALMEFKADFMKGIEDKNLTTYVNNLEQRVATLNDMILEIAGPYARAGSSHRFAIGMRGWSKWMVLATQGILEVKSWVAEASQSQKQDETDFADRSSVNLKNDVHFLHNFLNVCVFKDGFFLLTLCFMDQDVSERAATVIQSMQPMHSSGIDVNKEADKI